MIKLDILFGQIGHHNARERKVLRDLRGLKKEKICQSKNQSERGITMKMISKAKTENLLDYMQSMKPSVHIPPTEDERVREAVTEALKTCRFGKVAEVTRRIMAGQNVEEVCAELKIDRWQVNMCLGEFYTTWEKLYESKLNREAKNRADKKWL